VTVLVVAVQHVVVLLFMWGVAMGLQEVSGAAVAVLVVCIVVLVCLQETSPTVCGANVA
jgi:hypothetical protein